MIDWRDDRIDFCVRVGFVGTLVLVGIGLTIVGASFGVDESIVDRDDEPAVELDEDAITVSTNGEETTVHELENVTEIEISETDGIVDVQLERTEPLTDADRTTAIDVATENETVREILADPAAYDFEVESIERQGAESVDATPVEADFDANATGDSVEPGEAEFEAEFDANASGDSVEPGEEIELEAVEVESVESDDRITIDREPSYVQDKARVTITDPETDERLLSLVVELGAERVISITE